MVIFFTLDYALINIPFKTFNIQVMDLDKEDLDHIMSKQCTEVVYTNSEILADLLVERFEVTVIVKTDIDVNDDESVRIMYNKGIEDDEAFYLIDRFNHE